VDPEAFQPLYRALQSAMAQGLTASVRGLYRGGLAVHAALAAMAGGLGLTLELAKVPTPSALRADKCLFSESAGRFLVTVPPACRAVFEDMMGDLAWGCVGTVTAAPRFEVIGDDGQSLVDLDVEKLKAAWKSPFGDLV
jgi:phosphoribosylformylglycinamidine synthase